MSAVEALQDISLRVQKNSRSAEGGAPPTKIIAVTKTFERDAILPLLDYGHKHFGENRVQEAIDKWPGLRQTTNEVVLHMIGPLQTNKVKDAVALFDMIHTLDRPRLAEKLSREMDLQKRRIPCLVQVNTGQESQKSGVDPKDADAFVAECREKWNLPIEGLMCIPPAGEEPSPHFAFLREIARRNNLKHLSMGMSGDFEIAVMFGATFVRVGSAIFGQRRAPAS